MKLSDLDPKDITVEKAVPSKKKGSLKLSDLNAEDIQVESSREPMSSPEEYDLGSMANTAVNEFSQGITGGFADEIEAGVRNPMGGAKSLLGLLGQDNSADADVQAYTKTRDGLREAYAKSAEENPTTAILANIAGSIVPGMGATKLIGPAGKLAKGFIGPANAATLGQKMVQGAKVGALGGGVYGAGVSEADLAKGEVGQLAGDTIESVGLGAGMGGAFEAGIGAAKAVGGAAKGLASGIANTQTAQNLKEYFKFGTQKTDLVTKKGFQSLVDDLVTEAKDFAVGATDTYKDAGKGIKAAKEQIRNDGITFDISAKIDEVEKIIQKLDIDHDPASASNAAYLKEYVTNLRKGLERTADVQHTVYTPKSMPAGKSAMQKLEEEAAKAKETARVLGVDLRTEIVESTDEQGNKLLTLLKTTDEPIGNGETLSITPAEVAEEAADEVDPFFKSWGTNGPKELKKANEFAALQNSKAQHNNTGKVYKVFDDRDHGVIHVMELDAADDLAKKAGNLTEFPTAPPKSSIPELPAEPTIELTPDSSDLYKTTAAAKTVLDVPAAAPMAPPVPEVVTTQVKHRPGVGAVDLKHANIDEVQNVIDTFNRMTALKGGSQPITVPKAVNVLKQQAGALKDQLTTPPMMGPEKAAIEALNTANQKSDSAYQALKVLFGKEDAKRFDPKKLFDKDPVTGETRLKQNVSSKLITLIRQSETDSTGAINADDRMKAVLKLLGEANPELAAQSGPKLERAARAVDLAQKVQGMKFTKSSMMERLPMNVANRAGMSLRALRDKTPESWVAIADKMAAAGGKAGRVGGIIREIAKKDDMARNATLFSLEQQPWAREVLDEWFDKDEKKSNK